LPTILAHELLLGVGLSSSGSTLCSAGATSPTTSTASAGFVGCAGMNSAFPALAMPNSCNTLPHTQTTSTATTTGIGMPNNLQLSRNLVMLRNHLRKNTNASNFSDEKEQ
ncbi:uncharacterized protein LOC119676389, partial [Teleopsis dalmanni]|uniref:uncharacterized protein LOC119676389 n=1 Tax=Teleopsis dalmanni TaxID=139649 RepID=UPI0018CF632F